VGVLTSCPNELFFSCFQHGAKTAQVVFRPGVGACCSCSVSPALWPVSWPSFKQEPLVSAMWLDHTSFLTGLLKEISELARFLVWKVYRRRCVKFQWFLIHLEVYLVLLASGSQIRLENIKLA